MVGEEGEQLGILSIRDALFMARDKGLDLIEVAPTANPPVCRIMDYGKYKYDQGKHDREARKKQHTSELKGIMMRPGTDEHDYLFKVKNAVKFLEDGDKVKITIRFRSREITHPEIARRTMERIIQETSEIASIEKPLGMEGRTMTMILSPK